MIKQDFLLRMYNEAFRNNHAHYGYWEPNEQLTMDNLRKAMERYSKKLVGKIPPEVKSVLDAGCGWGGNALELKSRGFNVTALSPDIIQRDHFQKLNSGIEFVLSEYEEYSPDRQFDLVLMSESCQYINLQKGAAKSARLVQERGYVLVADYFIKQNGTGSIVRKWGHSLDSYLSVMRENGFSLVMQEDITESVAPTLELAQQLYADVMRPVFRFLYSAMENRYPLTSKAIKFALKRFSRDGVEKMLLSDDPESKKIIDADEFRKNKQYMVLLFQKNAA